MSVSLHQSFRGESRVKDNKEETDGSKSIIRKENKHFGRLGIHGRRQTGKTTLQMGDGFSSSETETKRNKDERKFIICSSQ